MKNLVSILVIATVIAASIWAAGRTYWNDETVSIAATTTRITDTVVVSIGPEAPGIHGIVGKAILPISTYTANNFGVVDTARIVLKSRLVTPYSVTWTTIDSVLCTPLPCTLEVNAQDDSLFAGELFFDIYVADSGTVAADSTAPYQFNYSLKALF